MRHVIIGAGAAGAAAVKAIRELRPEDDILVISRDEQVHSRCMLHKYISGERSGESLCFLPADLSAAFGKAAAPGADSGAGAGTAGPEGAGQGKLEWLRGKPVSHIDTAAKTVTADGGTYAYDRLLIATGANSVVPPIGQLRTAKNAFGLRHLTDAAAIRAYAEKAEKAAVVGAGLVGLDAAYALMELGKKVTIIEMAETALALNLDAHAAAAYQAAFERRGAVFRLGRKAANTVSDDQGRITRLELDQGAVDCDMVVMALGVRPAVELLEGSGIAAERAIKVDTRLRTSAPDVYAAGDVAGLSGIWPNAVKQGDAAGRNMCGLDVEYTDSFAIKNTINFFGLVTLSVGAIHPQAGDTVIIREDRFVYKKFILRNGTVAGVILQGDIAGSGFWQYLIKNRVRVDQMGKPVWKLSYADFYGVEPNGEYQLQVRPYRG
jgi:NAD(P)H-nitrite reductase large subunit